MVGFTCHFVNSPKYGRLQEAVNYQDVPRNLDNMIFTSLRDYIP